MKKTLILISILMSFNLMAAPCELEFKKANLCAQIKFVKDISRKYSSDFVLSFMKDGKKVLPTQELNIFLWMKMNGHEHGSTKVKLTKKADEYLVEDVWFLMTGLWHVNIELRQNGKVFDSVVKDICIGNSCKDVKNIKMH